MQPIRSSTHLGSPCPEKENIKKIVTTLDVMWIMQMSYIVMYQLNGVNYVLVVLILVMKYSISFRCCFSCSLCKL